MNDMNRFEYLETARMILRNVCDIGIDYVSPCTNVTFIIPDIGSVLIFDPKGKGLFCGTHLESRT